jgi:hypothetical protein
VIVPQAFWVDPETGAPADPGHLTQAESLCHIFNALHSSCGQGAEGATVIDAAIAVEIEFERDCAEGAVE